MCGPTAFFMASSAFSAYGKYKQGQAQAKAQEYQARVSENNAEAARLQVQQVTNKENIQKDELRKKLMKTKAQGRVGFAASGIKLGSGSALDWELDLVQQNVLDESNLEYNADLERNALINQSSNFKSQATLSRSAAADSRQAGIIGAGTSLLSSAYSYKLNFGGSRVTSPQSDPTQS